jgi:tRNA-5-taurinomethyluridine 2-sulfurtransferase
VASKDPALNVVAVSRAYHAPGKRRDAFAAGPFNWLGPERPVSSGGEGRGGGGAPPLTVKVRHGPHAAACRLLLGSARQVEAWAARAAALGGGGAGGEGGEGGAAGWRAEDVTGGAAAEADSHGLVLLEGRDQGLAAGQHAVFYQGGACLGAAVILGAVDGPAGRSGPPGGGGGGDGAGAEAAPPATRV